MNEKSIDASWSSRIFVSDYTYMRWPPWWVWSSQTSNDLITYFSSADLREPLFSPKTAGKRLSRNFQSTAYDFTICGIGWNRIALIISPFTLEMTLLYIYLGDQRREESGGKRKEDSQDEVDQIFGRLNVPVLWTQSVVDFTNGTHNGTRNLLQGIQSTVTAVAQVCKKQGVVCVRAWRWW